MKIRSYKLKQIKSKVESVWQNPKAQLLENHYKFINKIIREEYPNTVAVIAQETLNELIYDVVYLDRFLRRKRQGKQNGIKKQLSAEFKQLL